MARRILFFILLTALLVGACVWVADRPGAVTIHWLGWRLDTTVPVLLFGFGAILVLVLLAQRLMGFLIGFPRRWLARRQSERQRKGYLALSDGLAAVAGGDAAGAHKLAAKAESLLHDPQITGLLSAQAAGLSGDENAARTHYQRLLSRPETALSGCQGMLSLALKQNDSDAALDWARRAWATGTSTPIVAETLYDLQARAGQWAEAEITVIEAVRRKAFGKDKGAARRAVALLERALHLHSLGEGGTQAEAMALALSAHQADPGFVPAAVLAARLLAGAGKMRRAGAVLNDAWERRPHPDLAQAWRDLVADEAPLTRVSRLQKIFGTRALGLEAHLALARAALDAELWGVARSHLEAVLKGRPTRSAFLLLANLERLEKGDHQAAAQWSEKAGDAPADADWVCGACGGHAHEWRATCPHCGRAAALEWTAK